ncbi:hypothetical protein HZS55_14775 [Halosimplex rubrum]|uniref:Uncharacterized protein n=1 Tax=Halosimplex rubrum TaxID=869889 RepID=A0A7D5TDS9_9EURY|nr:hypothetical protein [Halosimplex rubrum]QLH78476.1 hypothetical protein HZS55_14775 [Halosimplex rubrum]
MATGDLPSGQYADIGSLDGRDVLIVDTDNIPIRTITDKARSNDSVEEYSDLIDTFKHLHKVSDGFPIKDWRGVSKVMNTEGGMIDEVIDRFHGRVHPQFLPVIEEALVLREMDRVRGLSQEEVYDIRSGIGQRYADRGHDPEEAQYLVSMCSMGYLDKGSVFDQMYSDLVINGKKTENEYRDTFKMYVSNNPFAVFVRPQDKSVADLVDEATDKAGQIFDWPGSPEFVDVCAKGGARALARDARAELQNEFDGEMEVTRNDELEQYILTLHPNVTIR